MNEKLFEALFGRCKQGYLTLWRLPDKRVFWYKAQDYQKAYADALSMSAEFNVFFGLGLRRKKLADGKRGGDADVMTVTALCADIDVKGPAHTETALPETREEAEAFLNALPLRPSAVIWSGNGLHAYWILENPFVIGGAEEQKRITGMSHGFSRLIAGEGRKRGWKLDNVADLSRALRVPGSINHKLDGGAKCEALSFEGTRYGTDAFLPYKEERPAPSADRERVEAAVAPTPASKLAGDPGGDAARIMEKCAFIRRCRDNAAALPEPYWHAMITNLAPAKGGAELAHEISRPYPNYRKSETDEKIARAVRENKPHTCAYSGTAEDAEPPLELNGLNTGAAVQPAGWKISMGGGIQKMIQNKVGSALTTICPTPVVITRRLENIDDDSEKIELAFFRNGRWKHVLVSRSQVFSKSSVVRLADSGLPVSSESAGEVVKYLCAYENANLQAIPYIRSVGRIGWLKNEFFPFVTEKPIVFESDAQKSLRPVPHGGFVRLSAAGAAGTPRIFHSHLARFQKRKDRGRQVRDQRVGRSPPAARQLQRDGGRP